MSDDAQTTRRKLVGGTAAALSVGLAGCGSVLGGQRQSGGTPTPDGTPASSADGTDAPGTGSPSGDSGGQGGQGGNAANYHALSKEDYGIDLTMTPVLGSADADVDILYWSDYQCPFCEEFETETFPKLVENEISAGRARLLFFQFPNIGSTSVGAAMLARSVWHQVREDSPGLFGDWHAYIFEHQEKPNSGWAKYQKLVDLTREVDGVDAQAADEYTRSNQGTLESRVKAEKQLGVDRGISGTPGFVLYAASGDDRTKLMGAQPYPRFETAIDRLTG